MTEEGAGSEDAWLGQDLVVTLRDGSEHVVALDPDADAATVLDDVSAGRSRLLRGWVSVRPPIGSGRALVSGDEIIRLRLVERRL
jgi:hypothetical protein